MEKVKTRLKALKEHLRVEHVQMLNKDWEHKIELRFREHVKISTEINHGYFTE